MDVDKLIEEKFVLVQGGYTPKNPGNHEYRQCGTKESSLILQIEEVLFELALPVDVLEEYACAHNYFYFSVYKKIRDAGWILLPYARHPNTYHLHRPNKHFNRKTAETDTALKIVSPECMVGAGAFKELGCKKIVFALSEEGSFVLFEGTAVHTPEELVSRHTPDSRRQKPGCSLGTKNLQE
ncbi:hypothetical protein NECID01_0860 [Nematocida sp. AWRm77]|nr:hypothetical protein NECID01_0860 [Nematocida sp. AWRm77]